MTASLAQRIATLALLMALAYIAWHLWLAFGLHVSPEEWLADVRDWLGSLGPSLMPDLGSRI